MGYINDSLDTPATYVLSRNALYILWITAPIPHMLKQTFENKISTRYKKYNRYII